MGVECEVIATDWDGIIPGLLAGKYDAIMAGMSITDERKEAINFSESYANTPIVIATREGSDVAGLQAGVDKINFDELSADEQATVDQIKAALDGKSVAVQGSTTHQNLVEEYFGDADVRTYDTMENAALDLSSERVDAFVTELPFLRDFQESDQGKGMVQVGPSMFGGPLGEGVGIGIRKDDTELVQKFNDAIEAAKADGTIEKLGQQWFGFDVTPVS
jgi:octopine/nopaline transport system substrate-binding protein